MPNQLLWSMMPRFSTSQKTRSLLTKSLDELKLTSGFSLGRKQLLYAGMSYFFSNKSLECFQCGHRIGFEPPKYSRPMGYRLICTFHRFVQSFAKQPVCRHFTDTLFSTQCLLSSLVASPCLLCSTRRYPAEPYM